MVESGPGRCLSVAGLTFLKLNPSELASFNDTLDLSFKTGSLIFRVKIRNFKNVFSFCRNAHVYTTEEDSFHQIRLETGFEGNSQQRHLTLGVDDPDPGLILCLRLSLLWVIAWPLTGIEYLAEREKKAGGHNNQLMKTDLPSVHRKKSATLAAQFQEQPPSSPCWMVNKSNSRQFSYPESFKNLHLSFQQPENHLSRKEQSVECMKLTI